MRKEESVVGDTHSLEAEEEDSEDSLEQLRSQVRALLEERKTAHSEIEKIRAETQAEIDKQKAKAEQERKTLILQLTLGSGGVVLTLLTLLFSQLKPEKGKEPAPPPSPAPTASLAPLPAPSGGNQEQRRPQTSIQLRLPLKAAGVLPWSLYHLTLEFRGGDQIRKDVSPIAMATRPLAVVNVPVEIPSSGAEIESALVIAEGTAGASPMKWKKDFTPSVPASTSLTLEAAP